MDSKDKWVLKKIYDHLTSVIGYCSECGTLESFQDSSMRVEACVFNLMQIVWDVITDDLPKMKNELEKYI